MYQNHTYIHVDFTLFSYVTMVEFSCKRDNIVIILTS